MYFEHFSWLVMVILHIFLRYYDIINLIAIVSLSFM